MRITRFFSIWSSNAFFHKISFMRNRTRSSTATVRSIDDMIYFRTSFIYVSIRASCLIDLIWRYCWIISSWAIEKKWNQDALFERLRMNSNRSKIAYSRFCRIVCWFWLIAWDLFDCWCLHIIIKDHEFELTSRLNRILFWRY